MCYLIDLSPDQLLAVEVVWHDDLDDVDQCPEGVFLVHEEQGDGGDPVESLAILGLWVVEAVGKQHTPQLGDAWGGEYQMATG